MSPHDPNPAGPKRPAQEQRQSPRRRVRGVRCRVQVGVSWVWAPAAIVDFSARGVRLRTPVAWGAGQVRRIRITAGAVRLELEAACVWSRAEGRWTRTVGAAFRGVTPAQEALLGELLARHGIDPFLSEAA